MIYSTDVAVNVELFDGQCQQAISKRHPLREEHCVYPLSLNRQFSVSKAVFSFRFSHIVVVLLYCTTSGRQIIRSEVQTTFILIARVGLIFMEIRSQQMRFRVRTKGRAVGSCRKLFAIWLKYQHRRRSRGEDRDSFCEFPVILAIIVLVYIYKCVFIHAIRETPRDKCV